MDDIHKLKNNCICFRNSQVKEPYVNDSPITCLKRLSFFFFEVKNNNNNNKIRDTVALTLFCGNWDCLVFFRSIDIISFKWMPIYIFREAG